MRENKTRSHKFAAKPHYEKQTITIHYRVFPRDKERWKAAAKKAGKPLARWMTDSLNANSREA